MSTNAKVQVKFMVDSDAAVSFKSRCAAEGISMASVINQWMKTGYPAKKAKMAYDTRPHRKKTIADMIFCLERLLGEEEQYRDAIPEQFISRYEAACQSCDKVEEAISCLDEAFY